MEPPLSPPLRALLELGALDRLPRTGWIQRGVPDPESVAGHVLGTAYVALHLASRVCPPLDRGRVLTLALVHDAPEALSGDLPRAASELLPAGAKRELELGAARRLLGPLDGQAVEDVADYADGRTREARFVRLCDKLQLGVRLLGYVRSGRRGLEDFRDGLEALDCSEFEPAEQLRRELLAALGE